MKFDIVTFGSAVIDNFVTTEIADKNKFFSYPVGSKILINDLRFDIGGGATNTAVAFSRLGFKTGCITKVGKDVEGKSILDLLKKEKVSFLGSISKERTGHSIILDSRNKDRTILTFKGPVNDIKEKDISSFQTKWLYLSSVLGESFKTQKKVSLDLFKSGIKIAFNPSNYLIENEDILPLLKITEILILNEEEALSLCRKYGKKGDIEKAIHSLGPKIVVITKGDKGAIAYDGNKTYKIEANKVNVVEITGAGDAFAAGFVSGNMANLPIEKCLELGIEESTAIISHFGAKKNLIRRKLI